MPDQIVVTDTVVELVEVALQGPPGPQGPAGAPGGSLVTGTAGAALSGHMAVAYASDGTLVYASADNADHAYSLAGVTTGAAVLGEQATVQRNDVIEHNGWTWTPGTPVYVGLSGALVQTPALGSVYIKPVGLALTATRLMLSIQPAVFLA